MLIGQPACFDALKQEIGLTHVPDSVATSSGPRPGPRTPCSRGVRNSPPRGQDDDSAMRRGIDIAHEKDLKVWICTSGWHGGGDRYPGLVQWFECRAGVITANLKLFKGTACEAAGRDIVFGSDTP